MNKNLTATQNDYAVFLPATSGFYSTFIGKQRYGEYVDPNRLPASFNNSMESLNYLNPTEGLFYYNWCLYSAGHANLDLTKQDDKEDMFRNRDRTTSWVLGDSGGFQIGKGVWAADWKDPSCPKAQKKREQVLAWMDALMDYGMCLDIPAWVARSPAGKAATGITSYEEAVQGTYINNEYFINNRNGNCKFLNVLQGESFSEADDWYDRMKKYCDPKQYGDRAFNGWAMGGQNMCDVHLVLKRLIALRHDGLLETGQHDWMHFLGTSKLEWATLLTDIQRAVRKYHNPNFTISFDCASPFLATANGQIYVQTETNDREKWVYRMVPGVDNKKYASDTRLFKDVVIQDKVFAKNLKINRFESSPIIDQVQIKDICIYGPGDLNKNGKEGKTSWDSFSYAIQMGHNVWHHINAVQEANRQYDSKIIPAMLSVTDSSKKQNLQYPHGMFFRDIVNGIFETSDRSKAEALVEEYKRYWLCIPGTRGAIGSKTISSKPKYYELFDEPKEEELVNFQVFDESGEFTEDAIHKLEELESNNED